MAALDRHVRTLLPKSGSATIAIPGGQQPVSAGRLVFRLGCTRGCRAYAFGFASIAGGATLNLHSARFGFARAGTKLESIRFTSAQERRLRSAAAGHRRIVFELFGAALASTGRVGNVSPAARL
jgi:hypothetical protein